MSVQNGTNTAPAAGRVSTINALEETRRQAARQRAQSDKREARQHTQILSLLVGLLVTLGVYVWMVTSGVREHVQVLRVDAHGIEQPLEAAPAKPLKPEQSIIVGVLRTWVEHVRWISDDRRIFHLFWERVEDFTTQAGLRRLQDFRVEQTARQQRGRRVQVTVGKPMPLGRQSLSYTLSWCEAAYDLSGHLIVPESGALDGDPGDC